MTETVFHKQIYRESRTVKKDSLRKNKSLPNGRTEI